MNCDETQELIGAYTDDELSSSDQRLVEQHIAGCAACHAMIDEAKNLSALIRKEPRRTAPPELRAVITGRLDGIGQERKYRISPPRSTLVISNAAALLFGVLVTVLATQYLDQNEGLNEILVATHLRHTSREAFGIVTSSDSHTIRPWFTGKVDYAPPVVELSEAGFPLFSGRVETVSGRAVATLSYGRRKHQLSLFIFPKDLEVAGWAHFASGSFYRGFNVETWQQGGFSFAAVSDLNANELSAFADLIRVALGEG